MYLTNIEKWEDPLETALLKASVIDENGKLIKPLSSPGKDIYGQCLSKERDSDAWWHIFSPNKEGVTISTTAKKK